jgi:hypothetical protein
MSATPGRRLVAQRPPNVHLALRDADDLHRLTHEGSGGRNLLQQFYPPRPARDVRGIIAVNDPVGKARHPCHGG